MTKPAQDSTHSVTETISDGMKKFNAYFNEDPSLRIKQSPYIGLVICSDSRVPPEVAYGVGPGKAFVLRNVGNSMESGTNPNELSIEAKEYLTYAIEHLGVKDFRIVAHEACGCMHNAHACNYASSETHDHHKGPGADIIQTLGERKNFAIKGTSEQSAPAYLLRHGLPVSENDPIKNHIRQITVNHAFHQVLLAKQFIAKEFGNDTGVHVTCDYLDIGSSPCALYSYDENTGKFLKASQTPPAAPEKPAGKAGPFAFRHRTFNHSN